MSSVYAIDVVYHYQILIAVVSFCIITNFIVHACSLVCLLKMNINGSQAKLQTPAG